MAVRFGDRRGWLALLVVVTSILGLAAMPDVMSWWRGVSPENRHDIYAIREALRPGMTREQLDEVLGREASDLVRYKWKSSDRLMVWVPVGFLSANYLYVDLMADRVVHAQIRGDSGNQDLLPDAPPDF
jgi:hypothetical protein